MSLRLCALQKGHLAAVKALLAAKAKVNVRTRKAMTPLHFAAAGGHAEMVAALVRKGADTAATNKQGQTPLDLAKDEAVVEALRTGAGQKAEVDKEDAGQSKGETEEVRKGKGEGETTNGRESDPEGRIVEKGDAKEESQAADNVAAAGERTETTTGRESGGLKEGKVEMKVAGKSGKDNLRKHRVDHSEEVAEGSELAPVGPVGKKAKTVNLSYFDTEGEET